MDIPCVCVCCFKGYGSYAPSVMMAPVMVRQQIYVHSVPREPFFP
jgi:hypothetical protein